MNASGARIRAYAYWPGIDQPHSMRTWESGQNGATYYYALDLPSNNVQGLFGTTGSVAARYDYSPFGEAYTSSATVTNPLRFAARELDASTGLYYVRARWYDPYISEDPIGLAGGINNYAYALNDPVNLRDPSGLDPICTTRGYHHFEQRGGRWYYTHTEITYHWCFDPDAWSSTIEEPHHRQFGNEKLANRELYGPFPLNDAEQERLDCLINSSWFDDTVRSMAGRVTFSTGVLRQLDPRLDDGVIAARFPGSRVIFASGRFGPLSAMDNYNVVRITAHELGHEVQHQFFGSAFADAWWERDSTGMDRWADLYAEQHISTSGPACRS